MDKEDLILKILGDLSERVGKIEENILKLVEAKGSQGAKIFFIVSIVSFLATSVFTPIAIYCFKGLLIGK